MLQASNLPHGLGLLTTVASLPPKYRSRYLHIKTKYETPLDLSVKPLSPQQQVEHNKNNNNNNNINNNNNHDNDDIADNEVPIASNFTEVYTEPTIPPPPISTQTITSTATATAMTMELEKPMTPPLTPTPTILITSNGNVSVKRKFDEMTTKHDDILLTNVQKMPKLMTTATTTTTTKITAIQTPVKPIKASETAPRTNRIHTAGKLNNSNNNNNNNNNNHNNSKNKATRKLKFDEETSSPVSGTIIRPLEDITDGSVQYSNGDIDPRYNIVEISEESKAELAAIKNVIGDYICKLCRLKFDDAFGLARHRCACIVLLEYRCPECGKQFNCPANLASHRRWHKPKKDNASTAAKKENQNTINTAVTAAAGADLMHACTQCGKKFKRQAYLRKHQSTHAKQPAASKQPLPKLAAAEKRVSATVMAIEQEQVFTSYAGSTSSVSSFSAQTEEETNYAHSRTTYNEYDAELLSDCSSQSSRSSVRSSNSSGTGYGRLQIVESGLTEEENIAAAALTNLRNCASVIKHTTLAH